MRIYDVPATIVPIPQPDDKKWSRPADPGVFLLQRLGNTCLCWLWAQYHKAPGTTRPYFGVGLSVPLPKRWETSLDTLPYFTYWADTLRYEKCFFRHAPVSGAPDASLIDPFLQRSD